MLCTAFSETTMWIPTGNLFLDLQFVLEYNEQYDIDILDIGRCIYLVVWL